MCRLGGKEKLFVNDIRKLFHNYFVTLTCLLQPVMQISCAICSELFVVASDVFATACGHLFHYACLIQWIKRYYLFL